MKMIKRTLILLIIATTIFTVVKCNRIEDVDNIKQEQGDDTLPKEDKKEDKQDKEEKEEENKDDQDKQEQDKDDEPKEDQDKEEIESPVELG